MNGARTGAWKDRLAGERVNPEAALCIARIAIATGASIRERAYPNCGICHHRAHLKREYRSQWMRKTCLTTTLPIGKHMAIARHSSQNNW
jgi:hypothetical protein